MPETEEELSLIPVVVSQLIFAVKTMTRLPVFAGMVHVPHVGDVVP
jgi:hypothetical protein